MTMQRLFRRGGESRRLASSDKGNRLLELLAVLDDEERQHDTLETHVKEADQQPAALLVEHRDEVFARLATDMAESGMRVVRARSATEALKLCGVYVVDLVVANVDLPDQRGWLLAGKLRLVDQQIPVWLYQPKSTSYDEGIADFLRLDQLVGYGGDLLVLSETIIRLLASRRKPHDVVRDAGTSEELAAA